MINNKVDNNISVSKDNPSSDSPSTAKHLFYVLMGVLVFLCIYEIKQAYGFDIDKGISSTTKPIVGAVKKYWVTGVGLSGAVTALISEGDMRTRAVRAGIGSIAAGGVILGILAATG